MLLKNAIRRFSQGYFATCDRSIKTKAAYETDLAQFCVFIGPRRKVALVSSDGIEAWAGSLRAQGYKPASIRRKLASLRVFFSYWIRKGQLESSPFWRVRLSLGKTKELPRCLTEAEVTALLARARTNVGSLSKPSRRRSQIELLALRNLALVDLLFATGIRVGEACGLDVGDFAVAERTLTVRGKGGHMRLAFLTDPTTIRIQTAHLEARGRLGSKTLALFVNRFGSRLSSQGAANVVAKLAREASLSRHVTPHMLRHTVATLLLQNGVDIRLVQQFLGHASISTTQRYTFVSRDHLVSALSRNHPSKKIHRKQRRPRS